MGVNESNDTRIDAREDKSDRHSTFNATLRTPSLNVYNASVFRSESVIRDRHYTERG